MAKLLNVFILVVLTAVITVALSKDTFEERPYKACNSSAHCLRDCFFGGCCIDNTCDCAYLWDGWQKCPDYFYRGSAEYNRQLYGNRRPKRPHNDAAWRAYHPYNGMHGY